MKFYAKMLLWKALRDARLLAGIAACEGSRWLSRHRPF